jgi:hypothetical protein
MVMPPPSSSLIGVAVPVVRIRPVAVNVRGFLVDMLVRVGLRDGSLMNVEMVQVMVAVGMRVDDALVTVGMDVPLAEDEQDGDDHERPGGRRRPSQVVLQDDE